MSPAEKENPLFLKKGYPQAVKDLLDDIQASLLQDATEFRDSNITEVVGDYDKFQDILKDGLGIDMV